MIALRIDTPLDFGEPTVLDALEGETVANVAARAAARHVPIVATLNGERLLRKDWGHRLAANDNLILTAVPLGSGSKDVFRSVLQIALIVTAAYFLGPAGLGLTGWQFGAAMLVANAASGFLINAILPPEQAVAGTFTSPEAASPTYSLTASGNTARFGQVRPKLYGRHRIAPDFDAAPYTEYRGSDQYVFQLFNTGLGRYARHAMQIEDTDFWNEAEGITGSFPDVEFEVVPPGEPVTLFPPQVVTAVEVASQTLLGTNEEDHATIGPFIANPSGTEANVLAFDLVWPGGLYRIDDTGAVVSESVALRLEAQEVDDDGAPAGDWIVLKEDTFSAASRTPLRLTEKFPLAAGRWQGRATRIDEAAGDSRTIDAVQWEAMRAYLTSDKTSEDSTRIAMVMRATNQLSGLSSRRVFVDQTALLPDYLGLDEAGEPLFGDLVETRHIRDACFDAVRNTDYRPGIPALKIDYAGFDALHDTWAAREDYFDFVIDREMSIWEALSTILAVGRAHPVWIGDTISAVRDEPREAVKQFFSPRNIVRGSFKYTPLLPGPLTPNATIVEYYDRAVWAWREVYCSVRGIPQQTANAKRIRLPGCTVREKAFQWGIYQDASNTWRRELVGFGVEMEGEMLTRLDLLDIAHPMPDWGQTSAIRDFDTEARSILMSQDARWSATEDNYLMLRRPDGTSWGPVLVTQGDTRKIAVADEADLAAVIAAQGDWADFLEEEDGLREPAHCVLGAGEDMPVQALLIDAKAEGGHRMRLDCVVDDPRVYTAEDDFEMPAAEDTAALPGDKVKPVIAELLVAVSGTKYEPWLSATVTPARGATWYNWYISYDNATFEPLGGGATMLSWSGPVPPSTIWIRVTALGPGGSDTITRARNLAIENAPPGMVTGIAIRPFFDNAVASFSAPKVNGRTEEGVVGVILAASDESGFDPEEPGEAIVVYRRAEPFANRITFPLDYGTVYVRIAAYNVFGESGLNWSSEQLVTRGEIGPSSLSPALQEAFANAESLEGGVVFKIDDEGKIGAIALIGGDGEPIEVGIQADLFQLSHPGVNDGDPFPLLVADEDGVRINTLFVKTLNAEQLNAMVAEIGTLYGLIYATPLEEGETLDDAKLVIDTSAPYILMRRPAP